MSCATDLEEGGGAGGHKAPGEKCELRAGSGPGSGSDAQPVRSGDSSLLNSPAPLHFKP